MQTWLRLKPDLLPCISQEADKVANDYQTMIDRFRRGDKQIIQDILLLQASIRARIDEFDKFYEQNYADPKIAYFERTKMKLRKLLYTPIESPEQEQTSQIRVAKVENETRGYDYSQEEQKETFVPKATQAVKDQTPTKRSTIKQDRPVASKSPVATKTKSPAPVKEQVAQKHQQKSISTMKKPEEPKKKANAEEQNDMVFTIKMTKKEYAQYLQTLKGKNGNK